MFIRRAWAEIDVSALIHNFNLIKETVSPSRVMAVVKADAYGHGVDIVVPELVKAGADAFAVADLNEAISVRKLCGSLPILILGYTPAEVVSVIANNNITQTVYDLEYAKKLNDFAKKEKVKIKCHIKLDTGMGRLGFDCRNEKLLGMPLLKELKGLEALEFEGVFTHFSAADRSGDQDGEFTAQQYKLFCNALNELEKLGFDFKYKHCCNSAGILLEKDKYLNYSRSGIILYGLTPDSSLELDRRFKPVMTFKTVVTMVKQLKKSETVSYGRTFTADRELSVATLAVGYADGYSRSLSNKGYVLIHGKKCRVLGRVCMDQTVVDVTGIDVVIGDQAVVFGEGLAVEEVARLSGTVNYETICGLKSRVTRIAVKNKKGE